MSNPQFKAIVCKPIKLENGQKESLQTSLEINKYKFGYKIFDIGENYLNITYHEIITGTKNKKLEETLEFISGELNQHNVPKFESENNNNSTELGYYNLSGEGVILNKEDYEATKNQFDRINEQEKLERSSYMNGFIGSLLFSLPVIILWVLVAIYFEVFSSAMAILIAIGGYYGYEKFNGKLGIWTKWILVFSNIIVIFLANIGTIYFQLRQYNISFGETLSMIQNNNETQTSFFANLAISLTLGIVGWLWIISSVNTKRNFIQKAEKL